MQHLLEDLNDAQRRAVTHGDGPLLVVAGAGSGKTRVITRRIAWLLAQGVPERAILGVTFTNKAAREMAERVQTLVPGTGIRLSTFHSACAAWLRKSGHRLGFGPDFTIYDTEDRDRLLKALLRERHVATREIRPAAVGDFISRLKNDGIYPDDFHARAWLPVERAAGIVYGPYQQALLANNAMDFDDLLLHFLRIVDEVPEERLRYGQRFRHVLVDEFQDTNAIQYRIVRRLAEVHGNLCIVGDPDQSIYSFRGARIGNILAFPTDFPSTTIVKLETNYRSTATILGFAQRVISNNAQRIERELVAGLGDGEPVAYLPCESSRDEAQRVAYCARSLIERGVSPREIAVFYRARFLSRALEEALRRLSLPFHLVGDVGFFGRKEVKDLCAFLQVCVNPRDGVSLRRILNVPVRGIGKVSEERIFAEAAARGMSAVELLAAGEPIAELAGKAAAGAADLGRILADGRGVAPESVERTLRLFLDRTDYVAETCHTGAPQDAEREDNILEFLQTAREFDRERAAMAGDEPSEPAVAGYLTRVNLMSDLYARQDRDDAVQLMTVHAAKGLEFDHVFVIGAEEGLFPHAQSLDDPSDLEEERRLFYVACTRARRTLSIARAERRETYDQGARHNAPSRFLQEAGLELGRGSAYRDLDEEPVFQRGVFPVEEPEAPLAAAFRNGERVRHLAYGEGTILRCLGSGRSTKVEVLFPSGVRILLVEYANLERMEGS